MSRTGRQFRRNEDTQRSGDNTKLTGTTRTSGKFKGGEGRPQPQPQRRQQVRQTLNGLRGTNLANYLDDPAELD